MPKETKKPAVAAPAAAPVQQEVATRTINPLEWMHNGLVKYQAKVLPALLKKHNIEPDYFIQVVMNELKNNEKLLNAARVNPSSFFASILSCAEIGLIPASSAGLFYLIPRNLKGNNGVKTPTVCPQLGYKGLVQLLFRSGDIKAIRTEVVYEGDTFEYELGLRPFIRHVPNHKVKRDSANLTFIYAVAENKWGGEQFIVLSADEIRAIQQMSPYTNDLYFDDGMGKMRWMERKTALFQLAKLLPKDYYAQKAIEMDNKVTGGALLTMNEDDEIRIIEGAAVVPKRFRNISGGLAELAKEAGETE